MRTIIFITLFLVCSVLLLPTAAASPIIQIGEHPNLDVQFAESVPTELGSLLAQQFPQSSFVWDPPLVGFFSPVDPAQWVVWTPLAPDFNEFLIFASDAPCANNACSLPEPPPVPEPSALWLMAGGAAALATWRQFRR